MKPDIEIAQAARLKPIGEVAAGLNIPDSALHHYGRHIAKIDSAFLREIEPRPNGRMILVTAISPTPAGEGKTTTTVGLGDGLNRIGKKTMICLREPSLGPCFGQKGGAAGGGYAQIVPMGIDATQQALLAGAVDGATIREPTIAIVQTRDPRIKLVALGGDMFPNQPGSVVAVSGAFAQRNPQAVQAIVESVVKAIDLIQKDPKRAAPHIEAALGKGIIAVSVIEKALASPATKFVADPRAIIEATKKMQTYQVSLGTLNEDVPLDGLFDASYFIKATAK